MKYVRYYNNLTFSNNFENVFFFVLYAPLNITLNDNIIHAVVSKSNERSIVRSKWIYGGTSSVK